VINPSLVPHAALRDLDIGISVSDSADLSRLGLDARHAELAIGEIARAILVAGGRLTYGGRIIPSGFTQQLMHEIRRYGESRPSLTICLALPEHRKLSLVELEDIDRQLGTWGQLIYLDVDGRPVDHLIGRGEVGEDDFDEAVRVAAYSGLRRFMATRTSAQVLVGGQLTGFRGAMPGIIEEAIAAISAGHPVYFAGGFGGAAAAAARILAIDDFGWLPPNLPATDEDPRTESSLESLRALAEDKSWSGIDNGLDGEQSRLLAASHRPGEIASLVVLGLSRRLGRPDESPTTSGDVSRTEDH
jgi:hypothetical protein